LRADIRREGKVCTAVCYNLPKGLSYEYQHFFMDLGNEVMEIKNAMGKGEFIILGDFNSKI
jgi:hypothetical protein